MDTIAWLGKLIQYYSQVLRIQPGISQFTPRISRTIDYANNNLYSYVVIASHAHRANEFVLIEQLEKCKLFVQ